MVLFEPEEKLIYVTEPINSNGFYIAAKQSWSNVDDLMRYEFPVEYVTNDLIYINYGWTFADDLYDSKQNVEFTWKSYDESGVYVDKWTRFHPLGIGIGEKYLITDGEGIIYEEVINAPFNIQTFGIDVLFFINKRTNDSISTRSCGIDNLNQYSGSINIPLPYRPIQP